MKLAVVSPRQDTTVLRDPEAPDGAGSLVLEVDVDPPVEQVVWYVDDEPFAVVEPPYTARWPLVAGEHVFEARLPWRPERSGPVRVVTR